MMPSADGHRLTHRTIRDASGERLTPACSCGWYSPDCSHWRFERHLADVATNQRIDALRARHEGSGE